MSTFADLAALTIHDVKNRLGLVAARAEAAGDADTLRGVLESAAALTALLAWYRSENQALQPEIDARVPADLVNELVSGLRRQTALTVEADLAEAPALGFYDEAMIRMVLLDALYNAVRYARSTVQLVAAEFEDWLVFSVIDDGPGFPSGMLGEPLAMQPISRHGTGLGLHLAARVAALHENGGAQGRVEIDNTPGGRFRLFLPR